MAHASLAYWMDSRCPDCTGSGVTIHRRVCPTCNGSTKAALPKGGLEREKVLDLVSEMEGLFQSHNGRAAAYLRRDRMN